MTEQNGGEEGLKSTIDSWMDAVEEQAETVDPSDVTIERKGRGRARSRPAQPTPDLTFSRDELAPLVESVGNAMCRSFEVDTLSDTDVGDISKALAPVMSKYLGDIAERWGPEIALAGVLAKVALPRYMDYRERVAETQAETAVEHEAREDF